MAENTNSIPLGPYAQDGYTGAILMVSYDKHRWYLHNNNTNTYRPTTAAENIDLMNTGMINNEVFANYDVFILPPGVGLYSTFTWNELTDMMFEGLIPDNAFIAGDSPLGIKVIKDLGEAPDFVSFGKLFTGGVSMPYKYEGSKQLYSPITGKELDGYNKGQESRASTIGGTFEFTLPAGADLTKEYSKELLEQIISSQKVPDDYQMEADKLMSYKIHERNSKVIEDKGIALGETASQATSTTTATSSAITAKIEANKVANSVINSAG